MILKDAIDDALIQISRHQDWTYNRTLDVFDIPAIVRVEIDHSRPNYHPQIEINYYTDTENYLPPVCYLLPTDRGNAVRVGFAIGRSILVDLQGMDNHDFDFITPANQVWCTPNRQVDTDLDYSQVRLAHAIGNDARIATSVGL